MNKISPKIYILITTAVFIGAGYYVYNELETMKRNMRVIQTELLGLRNLRQILELELQETQNKMRALEAGLEELDVDSGTNILVDTKGNIIKRYNKDASNLDDDNENNTGNVDDTDDYESEDMTNDEEVDSDEETENEQEEMNTEQSISGLTEEDIRRLTLLETAKRLAAERERIDPDLPEVDTFDNTANDPYFIQKRKMNPEFDININEESNDINESENNHLEEIEEEYKSDQVDEMDNKDNNSKNIKLKKSKINNKFTLDYIEKMTIDQLRDELKKIGVPVRSSMRKAALKEMFIQSSGI